MLRVAMLEWLSVSDFAFQWAPTLGGECYEQLVRVYRAIRNRFNGHPPLGVNATELRELPRLSAAKLFHWAPTLGGECYKKPRWVISC